MNKPLAIERETIIIFNEAEATAEIETYNTAMKRRLEAIQHRQPDDIRFKRGDKYAVTYVFPKQWIKITPTRPASKKQREHLKQARAKIDSD